MEAIPEQASHSRSRCAPPGDGRPHEAEAVLPARSDRTHGGRASVSFIRRMALKIARRAQPVPSACIPADTSRAVKVCLPPLRTRRPEQDARCGSKRVKPGNSAPQTTTDAQTTSETTSRRDRRHLQPDPTIPDPP